ncbi:MAG: hypothetical protein P1S60_05870 [Anaerolineae bacterium]|nr:hypothetical protein [Anaerolineae bacterium]
MNSHKSIHDVDVLFAQALQSMADARPPRDATHRVIRRIRYYPPRLLRFMTWLHSFSALYFLHSHEPRCIEPYGSFQPSPFLSFTLSQLSDLKLAS